MSEVEMSTQRHSPRVDISTEWHIFACHTSPSYVICFGASRTKIWLNSRLSKTYSLLARSHAIITSRHNYVTSRVWSYGHHGASASERMWLAVMHDGLMWHISMSHQSDWIWANNGAPFQLVMRQYSMSPRVLNITWCLLFLNLPKYHWLIVSNSHCCSNKFIELKDICVCCRILLSTTEV